MAKTVIGRLAPSPTGEIHPGNAWSFLLAWLSVRSQKGVILLRMDDLDPCRSKNEYLQSCLEDMEWLGLDWDNLEFPRQSQRLVLYEGALQKIESLNLTYPCFCSRKELRMLASAPHPEDAGPVYPGFCRRLSQKQADLKIAAGQKYSLRFKCPPEALEFYDLVYGSQKFTSFDYGGDFPLKRSDGVISYQLATAVDDALMDVNLVVRGRDLLFSTPRQMLIAKSLGFSPPQYAHVPLLLNSQGERLAKRHASLSIRHLRQNGVKAERIIGYLAKLAGLIPRLEDLMPKDLISTFDWAKLPKTDAIAADFNF